MVWLPWCINDGKISPEHRQGIPFPFRMLKLLVGSHFPTCIIDFCVCAGPAKCSDGRRWLPFVKKKPSIHSNYPSLSPVCFMCSFGPSRASQGPSRPSMRPETRPGFIRPRVGSQGRVVCLGWGAWASWGSRPRPRAACHGGTGATGRFMKRSAPRRVLEYVHRNDAFLGPQFLSRGIFKPQTRGLFCGLNPPRPKRTLDLPCRPWSGLTKESAISLSKMPPTVISQYWGGLFCSRTRICRMGEIQMN